MQDRHYRHRPESLSKHLTLPETSLYYKLEVSATRYTHPLRSESFVNIAG